jgi:hypothetical protein
MALFGSPVVSAVDYGKERMPVPRPGTFNRGRHARKFSVFVGIHEVDSLLVMPITQATHTSPVKPGPATKRVDGKPVGDQLLAQFADVVEAGNDKPAAVGETSNETVDQDLSPADRQAIHELTDDRELGVVVHD